MTLGSGKRGLGRHYNFTQWQAIGIITVSCFAYMHLKDGRRK